MPTKMSASCRSCGMPILWLKREDGTFHAPLVPVGEALVLRARHPVLEVVYVTHHCRTEDVLAYGLRAEALLRRMGEEDLTRRLARAEQEAIRMSLSERKETAWAIAGARPCPKCHAEPKEGCTNLAMQAKGIDQQTSWPHAERWLDQYDADQREQVIEGIS